MGSEIVGSEIAGSEIAGCEIVRSEIVGSEIAGRKIAESDIRGSNIMGRETTEKKTVKKKAAKRIDINRIFRQGITVPVLSVLLSIMAAMPVYAGQCRMAMGGGGRMTLEAILRTAGSGWTAIRTEWRNIIILARTDT